MTETTPETIGINPETTSTLPQLIDD